MKAKQCVTKGFQVMSILATFFIVNIATAWALSCRPEETKVDKRVKNIETVYNRLSDSAALMYEERFVDPTHEQATRMIYGYSKANSLKTNSKDSALEAVLAGARWNDNPPFHFKVNGTRIINCNGTIRLPYHSACWYKLFKDGEKRAKQGEYFDASSEAVLLYRVHFGDMQFLHAMGSKDGERAAETKDKVMMWAEFTYKVALGEISKDTDVKRTGIVGMDKLFYNRAWTVEQLFTRGDPTFRKQLPDFAFGSLLHMIEDSFTVSHTERNYPDESSCSRVPNAQMPGKIISFHSYTNQDADLHHAMDIAPAFDDLLEDEPPTVIDVGRMVKSYYDAKRPWSELKDYLDCVFLLENPNAPAGPGEFVDKSKEYELSPTF